MEILVTNIRVTGRFKGENIIDLYEKCQLRLKLVITNKR